MLTGGTVFADASCTKRCFKVPRPWPSGILRLWGVVPSVLRLWVGCRGHHSTKGCSLNSLIGCTHLDWIWSGIRNLVPFNLSWKKHAAFVWCHFLDVLHTFQNLLCLHLQGLCVQTFTAWPFWLKFAFSTNFERPAHPHQWWLLLVCQHCRRRTFQILWREAFRNSVPQQRPYWWQNKSHTRSSTGWGRKVTQLLKTRQIGGTHLRLPGRMDPLN